MTYEEWYERSSLYPFDGQKDAARMAWNARVPEGCVIVPIEPTEEMLNEAFNIASVQSLAAMAIYKAMIQAAQEVD